MDTAVHMFEQARLGKAPFRVVGVAERVYHQPAMPPRAGGTCAYCGTCIRYACVIGSSDGRVFDVGRECVHKTDPRLYALYREELRAVRLAAYRAARAASSSEAEEARRERARIEAARQDTTERDFRAEFPDVARMIDDLRCVGGYAGSIALKALSCAREIGCVANEPDSAYRKGYPLLDKLRDAWFGHVARGHVGTGAKRETVEAEYIGTIAFDSAYGTQFLRRFAHRRADDIVDKDDDA